jgi:hypothetical protein
MKKLWVGIFVIGMFFVVPHRTEAFIIIDTGHIDDYSYTNDWGSATQFTLNQSATITSIETWMSGSPVSCGIPEPHPCNIIPEGSFVHLRVYADGPFILPFPKIPDTDIVLYEKLFQIPFTDDGSESVLNDFNWRGVSGISLDLPEGKYWAAFSKHSDGYARIAHGLPGSSFSAEAGNDFLPVGQAETCEQGVCVPNDSIYNYSLKVLATPEPSTLLLFGSGLLGAFYRRRKGV